MTPSRILMVCLAAVALVACSPASPDAAPTTAPAIADAACPEIVRQAMESTDTNCVQTGRNQVCYGNVNLEVVPRDGAASLDFDQPGDIIDLTSLESLRLSSMDMQTQEWGVALMAVQANLPDSLPGQNVTILLFGNVQLENAASTEGEFAFTFQSGVGDAPCAEAPDSGILVQTPAGAGEVHFTANGVDIQLGSTAYLQAQSGADMAINVVEGAADVTAQNVTRRVSAGTRTSVPLDASGQPSGPPSPPQPYQGTRLQTLPVTHLARPVAIISVLVSSSFAADTEGWSAPVDGTEIAYFPAEATSDGYICADDTSDDSDWYFQAPASWLGDQSAAYGGALRFTMRQSADDAQYDADDILLTGGGITLKYNTAENPGMDWTVYDAPLMETAGWINTATGNPPTRDEMMAVLSELTELRIRGEYREGEDTGCLDEVQLVSILMPMAQGQVVQIEPTQATPTGTPDRSVAGQTGGARPTATTLPAGGAPAGFIVTDMLATGEVDTYTFEAEAGQAIFFDSQSGSYYIRATLTDASGENVFENAPLDRTNALFILERGGTYTLTVSSVEGEENLGDYAFQIWDVPAPQTFTFEIGDMILDGVPAAGVGNIESPGAQDIYTFSAETGQTVFFDSQSGSYYLRGRLTDEAGNIVFENAPLDRTNAQFMLERGGMYTLSVVGVEDTVGSYAFQLWNVPAPQTFPMTIGDVISDGAPAAGAGNIESPGAQDIYTFSAETGQTVFFDSQSGSYYLRGRLTDETSNVVFENAPLDRTNTEFILERGGIYVLVITGIEDTVGTYSFQMLDVLPEQTFEFEIGDVISDGVPSSGAGNIEMPATQDIYTFTAEAGQTIFFDAQGGSYYMRGRLTDETGAVIFENSPMDRTNAAYVLERGGVYMLTINGVEDTTGIYGFKVWDVPAPQSFGIAVGDTVSDGEPETGAGNIETPGAQDIYTFTAQAGQRVSFTGQRGSYYMRGRLTDEAGTVIFENAPMDRATGEYVLERGGAYTLLVYGQDDTVGTYSFAFARL